MILILGLVNFIASNPGFAAWAFGVLLSMLAALLLGGYKLIYQQMGELKLVDAAVERRVGIVEMRLASIEPNVGAGQQALNVLTARIEKHMTDEEDQVWAGIRSLTNKLAEIQVENVEAHAEIKGQMDERLSHSIERLAKIETRMETIQSKMPNGQIQEMLTLLKKLAPV